MSGLTLAADARVARRQGQAYVTLAALAWSTAGVLQRELSVGAPTQVAGRALFAALALLVFVLGSGRGSGLRAFGSIGPAELAVAVFAAIASGSFIVALNHTTVANVLFMQAVAPIAAAAIAWVALGEAVGLRMALGMVVALCGVGVMIGGPGGAKGLGLGLSVLMTLAFAAGLVITRHRREVSMAPAFCLSQVLVLVAVGPFARPETVGLHDLGLIVLLGAGQIGLGFAFITIGARLIPAAEVASISLLEIVLGPFWVWLALSERPSTATLVGGAVVVAAVLVQASGGRPAAAGGSEGDRNRPGSRPAVGRLRR